MEPYVPLRGRDCGVDATRGGESLALWDCSAGDLDCARRGKGSQTFQAPRAGYLSVALVPFCGRGKRKKNLTHRGTFELMWQ